MSSIASIEFYQFCYPFHRPMQTAWGEISERRGVYLFARTEDGFTSIAEASPLQGFSRESLEDVQKSLRSKRSLLQGLSIPSSWQEVTQVLDTISSSGALLPTVSWALEMLLADLGAQLASLGLGEFICKDVNTTVTVNGLLSGSGKELVSQFMQNHTAGSTCFKLKLVPELKTRQIAALREIQETSEHALLFRIDCNRSLDLDHAKDLCDALEGLPIEYIEEPLEKPTAENLAALKSHSNIAVALDETMESTKAQRELLDAACCDVVIIKPALFGGFRSSLSLISAAEKQGIDSVVTSTLESPVGWLAGLHLAAAVQALQGHAARAAGFDTLSLFSKNFFDDRLALRDGIIELPIVPGLGFTRSECESLLEGHSILE